ncbi:MAG: hypothetical protein AAGI66_01900 [Cyanobacteria bacterium P01_H01_bin.74]
MAAPSKELACTVALTMTCENAVIEINSVAADHITINITTLEGLKTLYDKLPSPDILDPVKALLSELQLSNINCEVQVKGKSIFNFPLNKPPTSLKDIVANYFNSLL